MTNSCANCKWWYYDPEDEVIAGFGSCELASSDQQRPEHPESKAVARDTEGWHAWLTTRPDFWCNQWEVEE